MDYLRLAIVVWISAVALHVLTGCGSGQSIPAAEQAPPDTHATTAPDKKPSAHTTTSPANAQKSGHAARPNRLAEETSPYLLLHAHNPVDWYPWGPDALEKAKKENKLIFLSIGYSSCHWCHVMERESFLDEEIAALLNKHFVCIKVDREERPDVDSIYMTALHVYFSLTQAGRGGGWPLSMFLTPDGKPFFGGTYFPARDGDRGASTGFLTIIKRIHEYFAENPEVVQRDADTVTQLTKSQLEGTHAVSVVPIDEQLGQRTLDALTEQFDSEYGGFGFDPMNPLRPKFPEPSNLLFLLARLDKHDDPKTRKMLVETLEHMSLGGIYDHLGGGFHRYSVDRYWHIPHFEKMLYDNGQLATIYTDAFLLTGREDFRRVVVETLDFVLREMTDEQGGFYSALDAESQGEEGKFYRWEKSEIKQLLTEEEYEFIAPIYGLDDPPNFEEHYYALQLESPLRELAAKRNVEEAELNERLQPIREKLLQVRDQRERPLTDTKILTSWNGLMIRGMADAGRGLGIDRFTQSAKKAARFALSHLRRPDGRLYRTYGQGKAKLNAYLNDYSFLVDGLLALHRTTGEDEWLEAADQLTAKQLELFWDDKRGGFYFTSEDHEALLARAKNPTDGAQPSGNSVAAQNLIYLAAQGKNPDYQQKAEQTIQSTLVLMQRAPTAVTRMNVAVIDYLRHADMPEAPPEPAGQTETQSAPTQN